MDKDAADLAVQLCTRVGMIMEDTSILALTIGGVEPGQRGAMLHRLVEASERINRLLGAALALQD